jgi:hypothetical protein
VSRYSRLISPTKLLNWTLLLNVNKIRLQIIQPQQKPVETPAISHIYSDQLPLQTTPLTGQFLNTSLNNICWIRGRTFLGVEGLQGSRGVGPRTKPLEATRDCSPPAAHLQPFPIQQVGEVNLLFCLVRILRLSCFNSQVLICFVLTLSLFRHLQTIPPLNQNPASQCPTPRSTAPAPLRLSTLLLSSNNLPIRMSRSFD